jgi:membrane-bound inhibitor of C-type lysozyme
VFVNFDLSACGTHTGTYCSGVTPDGAPDFAAGYYDGRVDLMKAILYNLFGLPPLTGGGGTSGVEPKATFKWALGQNSPNPLASGTEIQFEVASASDVSIKVYNAMGQLVKVLRDGKVDPGRYSVAWDGRNASGERVSSGVYFYKMEGQQFDATKKMLVVK